MIYTETLSNGVTKYVVRVKRHGRRKVLGRFVTPGSAVECEAEAYRKYLESVWVEGREKSR